MNPKLFIGKIEAVEIDGHIYFDVVDEYHGHSLNKHLKDLKDADPKTAVVVLVELI